MNRNSEHGLESHRLGLAKNRWGLRMVPYNPAPRLAKQLGLSGELGAFAASLLGRDTDQGSVPRVLRECPWCVLRMDVWSGASPACPMGRHHTAPL